jgi:hypothetical protein
MIGVCVDPDVRLEDLRAHAAEYGLSFRLMRDPRGTLARTLGVRVTPEVVVLDDQLEVRYQGRIDDQYADRRAKARAAGTQDLKRAIEGLLSGQQPTEPKTRAVGCPLPELGAPAVTYTRDVAPILFRSCLECHRAGQIGPFSLETYEQARKRSEDLASVTADRLMPPWRAKPGVGPAFRHDRSLTKDEIRTLEAWAEAGAPEGDPADLPTVPRFSSDWKLGRPDLIVELPENYKIPAAGDDIYRCFVIPTNLPDDVYISGVEYRPGNAKVVHHILGYVDISGDAAKLDAAEPGLGYQCFGGPRVSVNNDLGGWAPGAEPDFLPEGIGRTLPKGAHVVMQVHYHPSGKPETDRSKLALYFAKKPVKQTFHWSYVAPDELKIAAGQKRDVEVKAKRTLPLDVEAVAVSPHMHLLGVDMTMWADLPDGRRIDLIEINAWDFQWQLQYYFERPIALPKGTVLNLVAHYDNSSDNPHHPTPDKIVDVAWGEATTDEMCIGFIGLVKAGQDLTRTGEKDDLRSFLRDR